jgi:hypothetical protein
MRKRRPNVGFRKDVVQGQRIPASSEVGWIVPRGYNLWINNYIRQ